MALSAQITCIKKPDRNNRHKAIDAIGFTTLSDNKNWKCSQTQAIKHIENGDYAFHVQVGGNKVNVIIATSPYGNKELRTETDNTSVDNLLSLKECPWVL